MNHWVPDFDVDDDHQPAETRNKSFGNGDEIMELLWQDGHVVMQSHQAVKKSPPPNGDHYPFMFMQEDEMATWLHHPLNDDAVNDPDLWPYPNHLPQFLGGDRVGESGANSNGGGNESTVVDPVPEAGNGGGRSVAATSQGGSSTNGELPPPPTRKEDTKRQGRETEEGGGEWDSEEYVRRECRRQLKKRDRTSSSLKRTRSSEVHNLSERRRRDRINERMKALQGLIPRCSKVDKASMLEDAIEYVKSLQTQVQLMSMGCGMFPVMLPYMNMGASMNMHLNRPMLFPHMNILGGDGVGDGSGSDGGGGWRSAHSLPGNPMPGHHQPHILPSRPSGTASTNPSDLMSGSISMWNQRQCPNSLVDQPRVQPRASRGSYSF